MSKQHRNEDSSTSTNTAGSSAETSQDATGVDNSLMLGGLGTSIVEGVMELTSSGATMPWALFEFAGAEGNSPTEDVPASEFATTAVGMFSTIDTEGDGYVSEEDIDAAMSNPDLSIQQAAALATLKSLRTELEELSNDELGDENDGITLADLQEYQRTGNVPEELRDRVEKNYGWRKGRIEGASTELFANGLPDPNAIRQGSLGDCWFLAAAGSVAKQNPQAIADMIADNGNGTYTVSFPNGTSATVDAPTNAELAVGATSGSDGMWITVLEKAFANIENDGDETWAQNHIDDASQPSRGTDVFSSTGSSDQDFLALTGTGTTHEKLSSAFADGRAVNALIGKVPLVGSSRDEGLPTAHIYSVTGYDPATQTVTIRNPWGHTEWTDENGDRRHGANDGVFTMTIAEFDDMFTSVSYAQGAPTVDGD